MDVESLLWFGLARGEIFRIERYPHIVVGAKILLRGSLQILSGERRDQLVAVWNLLERPAALIEGCNLGKPITVLLDRGLARPQRGFLDLVQILWRRTEALHAIYLCERSSGQSF